MHFPSISSILFKHLLCELHQPHHFSRSLSWYNLPVTLIICKSIVSIYSCICCPLGGIKLKTDQSLMLSSHLLCGLPHLLVPWQAPRSRDVFIPLQFSLFHNGEQVIPLYNFGRTFTGIYICYVCN